MYDMDLSKQVGKAAKIDCLKKQHLIFGHHMGYKL